MSMIASIMVDILHAQVDREFDYIIPDHLAGKIGVGWRVLIPLGGQKVEGIIISLPDSAGVPEEKLKPIIGILDEYPAILPDMIQLSIWLRDRYHCFLSAALRLMITAEMRGGRVREKSVRFALLSIPKQEAEFMLKSLDKRAPKQSKLLSFFIDNEQADLAILNQLFGPCSAMIHTMEKKGWIRVGERLEHREPYGQIEPQAIPLAALNPDQNRAAQAVIAALQTREGVFLLHGVTGSGKTEVYFHCVQQALDQGLDVIILVPEISLTPQMVERYRARFGQYAAVLHSGLSAGERFDQWQRVRQRQARVVIGARSAIFAPVQALGLIIMDEEHESSYQSENGVHYDTCEVALKRCELQRAVLLMGSATPSLARYAYAKKGRYQLLEMPRRVAERPMPAVELVDMRQEIARGNRSIFSGQLYRHLDTCLKEGKQAVLFMNRRGYSTFISCRACGYVMQCRKCDISMTYHKNSNRLKCHYCGWEREAPQICPSCQSPYIRYFGLGTQRVEEEVVKLFSQCRVLRMDNDTTARKDSYLNILKDFGDDRADILVGTQMIAKGLDFPNVTLVGVMAADATLHIPDWRSAEKTFQLITQVAGRAGRGDTHGRVVVQSYDPEHYAIQYAVHHDYPGFYKAEMASRRQMQFPPFSIYLRFLVWGTDEDSVRSTCEELYRAVLMPQIEKHPETILFHGCMPAAVGRIKDSFRWQIIFKLQPGTIGDTCIDTLYWAYRGFKLPSSVFCQMERNPANML